MYLRLGTLRQFVVAEANKNKSTSEGSDELKQKFTLNVQETLYRELCDSCVSTAHDALYEMHRDLACVHRSFPWHTLYCKI